MEYINKANAIQAIADCTTFRDRKQIFELCRRSICEENDWLGGIRDAISAVEDLQAEVWPLCLVARKITEDDFTSADDHGVIPAWTEASSNNQINGWSGWVLITKKNLLDTDRLYFTCRPTVEQLEHIRR